jgi:hypothetical protein
MSLRAGSALTVDAPLPPYDPELDRPNDEYLRQYAFDGGLHLDEESRRFYLPALIAFAVDHVADTDGVSALVVQTFLRFLKTWSLLRSPAEKRVTLDCLTILAEHPDSVHCASARDLLARHS